MTRENDTSNDGNRQDSYEDRPYSLYNSEGKLVKRFIKKSPYKFAGDWAAMSQEMLLKLAMNHDLKLMELRVLLYLIGTMGYQNKLDFKTVDVAEALGTRGTNVSRALTHLSKKNILIRVVTGKSYSYSLNPNLGFKGKSGEHKPDFKNPVKLDNDPEKLKAIEDRKANAKQERIERIEAHANNVTQFEPRMKA